MEIATKCPICETLGNSVSVYPSNVDESSFSTEIFSARRLPKYDYEHIIEVERINFKESNV